MFRNTLTKKRKLRKRLIWLFQRDAIESQLDCLIRSAFRISRMEVPADAHSRIQN